MPQDFFVFYSSGESESQSAAYSVESTYVKCAGQSCAVHFVSRWSNKCKCFVVRFVIVQASGYICNEKGEFLPSLKSRRSFC